MIALRDFESCAFCPKLCRHVCPVAVGTGREAATPTAMICTTSPGPTSTGSITCATALRTSWACRAQDLLQHAIGPA